MTEETMTIHKALCELKIISSRITNAIYDAKFVMTNKKGKDTMYGISTIDVKKKMLSEYDKIQDLIDRRNAIKKAVILSNATTKVIIDEQEYYVSEAIDMKNNGNVYYNTILDRMVNQYSTCISDINNASEKAIDKAEKAVLNMYGVKESTTNNEIETFRQNTINLNSLEIIDPIGIEGEIKEIKEMINNFTIEIDSALSESNALTKITITY